MKSRYNKYYSKNGLYLIELNESSGYKPIRLLRFVSTQISEEIDFMAHNGLIIDTVHFR